MHETPDLFYRRNVSEIVEWRLMQSLQNEKQRQRSAILLGAIALVFTILICIPVLVTNDDGVLAFANIGERFAQQDFLNTELTKGYDGQFSYFIARDGVNAIPYIDGLTLRYQRIVYPLMARVLALGGDDLVAWTLLLVNVIAHSVGVGLMAYLLAGFGRSPYWTLLYMIWIGNLFAIRFDLNEPLCFTLALAGIVAYQQKRYRWTIFLLIVSTLTKELGAVIAAGLALHAALTRRDWGWAFLIFAAPVGGFLAWWGVMRLWFGEFPTRYQAAKIHFIPLEGLFSLISEGKVTDVGGSETVEFTLLLIFLGIPTIILLLAALYHMGKNRQISVTAALTLSCAGFVLVMPDVSWQDQIAAYRVGMPIVIAGILFVGESYPHKLKWLAGIWAPATLIIILLPQLWFGTVA